MVDNYSFLDNTFGVLSDEEAIAVCAFPQSPEQRQRDGRGWPVYDPRDPNIKSLLTGGRANTYFCISTVKRQGKLSRSKPNLIQTYVIPLDDIGYGEGSKYTPEDVPIQPTYKIETSRDNFQYGYVLETPIVNERRATKLIKLMAKESGDSGGSMASKIIRLPVGLNNKEAYNEVWDVCLTEYERTARFTVDELCKAFGIDPDDLEDKQQQFDGDQFTPQADDFIEWMMAEGWVLDDINNEGFYTIICPWHRVHTDGTKQAYFSPVGAGGAEHEHDYQFNCYHASCKDRHWTEICRAMFLQRFVLGPKREVFDTLKPRLVFTFEGLREYTQRYHWYATNKKTGKRQLVFAFNLWQRSKHRLQVNGEGFHPKHQRLYTDPLTGRRFNTFAPLPTFDYTTDEDRIEVILDQFSYLFDDEFDNAMSFFGTTVLRPEVRIQFALLHFSPYHGTGRGWVKELMYRLLTPSYVSAPTLHDFVSGQYNEYLYQTLLMFFDEVRQRSIKYNVQDRLRELITERRLMINQKWGFKGEADVFTNTVFLSNHLDALQIPDQDRRLWVVACLTKPRSAGWYKIIYDRLNDTEALRQFYWYLHRHIETHQFSPDARAPLTRHTRLAKDAGKSELEIEIGDLFEQLRQAGVQAIYVHHLYELCKVADIRLSPEVTGSLGGTAKERTQFWAVVTDCGAVRLKRARPSVEACKAMPNMTGDKSLVITLDPAFSDLGKARIEADTTACNKFLNKAIEEGPAGQAEQRNLLD